MPRRACLAIGVGTVTPQTNAAMKFGYLDGAPVAARTLGEWALRSGFGEANVRIVTDEYAAGKANPVTRERVQQAVDELFAPGTDPVAHLILVFCGHGMTDANFNSISWLFGDSLQKKYRVVADAFYAELRLYGIERITLISDACREAPKDADLLRLDAVRGILVNANQQVPSPRFDRFTACQDTKLGYMLSDAASADPGKCVFSGVIADALWGLEPTAFEGTQITVRSLGDCVQQRTPTRAADYHLVLNPDCSTNAAPAVIYDRANPPDGPPQLQPWPAAGSAAIMGASDPVEVVGAEGPETEAVFERLQTDTGFRDQVLGSDFGSDHPELTGGGGFAGFPAASKAIVGDLVGMQTARWMQAMPRFDRARQASPIGWMEHRMAVARPKPLPPPTHAETSLIRGLAAQAAARSRKQAARAVRRSVVQLKPVSDVNGSNLIVAEKGVRVWSHAPIEVRRKTSARQGFRVAVDDGGLPVLIEFEDGAFVPAVPYQGLYSVIKRSPVGDVFQAYGERNSRGAFTAALKTIGDFAAGRIDASQVDRLAADLRRTKHSDPVLGVICAYLYRATADFDNIRRMAYFYIAHGQPVPFDIALLGEMAVEAGTGGKLSLTVPAVKARSPDEPGADLPRYATEATPEKTGAVGGRCPWLGLGWDYVAMPRPQSAALVDGLGDYAQEVPRRAFTQLPAAVGQALAKRWGLVGR